MSTCSCWTGCTCTKLVGWSHEALNPLPFRPTLWEIWRPSESTGLTGTDAAEAWSTGRSWAAQAAVRLKSQCQLRQRLYQPPTQSCLTLSCGAHLAGMRGEGRAPPAEAVGAGSSEAGPWPSRQPPAGPEHWSCESASGDQLDCCLQVTVLVMISLALFSGYFDLTATYSLIYSPQLKFEF